MIGGDTERLLEGWAEWSRINPGKVKGYPSRSSLAGAGLEGWPLPAISDEEALRVDRAVSALAQRSRPAAMAVVLYYQSRRNLSYTARALRVSRYKAEHAVMVGTAWVDARLTGCTVTKYAYE